MFSITSILKKKKKNWIMTTNVQSFFCYIIINVAYQVTATITNHLLINIKSNSIRGSTVVFRLSLVCLKKRGGMDNTNTFI